MRILHITLTLIFAIVILSPFSNAASISPFERAAHLDNESKASLGVGIWALGLLLEIDGPEGHIFRKDFAISDGIWNQLVALQKNGYARITYVTNVPDGSASGTEHILVKLTDKGRGIVETLKLPKY